MQAIILAAGMGKRLKDLTSDNTKCMVKVNGVTLIERALSQLDQLNLSQIVIVVGYQGQKLVDFVGTLQIQTPILYVENAIYDKTNNIYSLSLAKEYLLAEDTLLLESDLIFEYDVLKSLVEDPRPTLAVVDKYESWMDGTCVELSEDDSIISFVPGKSFDFERIDRYYKTVNIYKFSKEFSQNYYVPFLDAYTTALGRNEYYEQVLRVIALLDDSEIKGKRLNGQVWYEIDDIQDLDIASSLFAESAAKKTADLQGRYGGYWRYPHMLDFCYLVNPYFPPNKLKAEMKANFDTLLTQYPSGMRVNSLLAAKNFGVHSEHIVVGNGAAELIKALMTRFTGKIGFVRPTFEEYPNRYMEQNSVVFWPQNENFSYSAEDLKEYFGDKELEALVLINPDNPSGNYIAKERVLDFADWCKQKGITLILDESFVDFAEEENASLIDEDTMQKYPNLIIVKSISKSYGVPGVRLGVLATGREDWIKQLKKDVAIWNINSFGEFYLQIAEKYRKDYAQSLVKIKASRKKFYDELGRIPGMRVIPSQANYLLVELTNGKKATALTEELLSKHDILIKDLSHKITMDGRQFIRLAVRDERDNRVILDALRAEMAQI